MLHAITSEKYSSLETFGVKCKRFKLLHVFSSLELLISSDSALVSPYRSLIFRKTAQNLYFIYFFLFYLYGIDVGDRLKKVFFSWPEWGLTNLSFRPRHLGVWPERQNFKGLKGTVLNVRIPGYS